MQIKKNGYEKDFYMWLIESAKLIREKKFDLIDSENMAEELEALARQEKSLIMETVSDLIEVLSLIKAGFFVTKNTKNHCVNLISEKRLQLQSLIADNKTLECEIRKKFNKIYRKSIEKISGIERLSYPEMPFFTFEDLLDNKYWPDYSAEQK